MNTITIELCAEDRARLDAILAELKNCSTPFPAPNQVCTRSAVDEATKEEIPAQMTIDEVPAKPAAPAVSHADVQRKVVSLSAAGKKTEVRDIVLAYNNTKVSDIPENKLDEVWEKLNAMEV